MEIIVFIFVFILGTIIGSFLNVVIYRFNTSKNIVNGRSMCMSCGKKLHWYELVPVISFIFQLGRCRSCKGFISFQYPFVEISSGLIFTSIAYHFLPILELSSFYYVFLVSFFIFIFSILIIISVYDLKHKIIPNSLVYTYAIFSFLFVFINHTGVGSFFIKPSIWDVFSGPILALPFVLLWYFSKGKWMGLGDGKLILGIGWMLGLSLGISSIIISFWIGGILSIFLLLFSKMTKVKLKTEIPFAPFLILGALVTFLFDISFYDLVLLFKF